MEDVQWPLWGVGHLESRNLSASGPGRSSDNWLAGTGLSLQQCNFRLGSHLFWGWSGGSVRPPGPGQDSALCKTPLPLGKFLKLKFNKVVALIISHHLFISGLVAK